MCDNHDDIPVKDMSEAHRTKSLVMEKERGLRRDEYHDRILQLSDENVFLKKHARKFEEKAKHLEAKLNRILSEKKFVVRKDEIDAEESKHRIIELEYQVGMLKDRLQVSKQQLASYTQLFPAHQKVKTKHVKAQSSSSNAGGADSAVGNSEFAEQFEVLLLEAKTENHALENQVKTLRDQVRTLERELETTREVLHIKEVTHDDELNVLRAQLGDADQTKRKLAGNIQLIRVQRDSRRASSWLSTLETQCKALESTLSASQETCQQLEAQLNTAQEELRESQQQNLNLQKQVEDNLAEISRVKELEAQLNSLQEENAILKETNNSLQLKLVSAGEKVREVETEGASLKTQISNMELTLKKELQSKTDLYSEVSREKNRALTLSETLNDLQQKFSAMEMELKRMEQESLRPAVSSSSMPEPAVTSVVPMASRATSEVVVTKTEQVIEDVQEVETQLSSNSDALKRCEYCKTLEKDLGDTKSNMEKLHDDLIKTKNLLKNQMATNRECHKEIEVLSQKLEKADQLHHEKFQEFMKVLEERAVQMQTLEKNLEVIKSHSRVHVSCADAEIQVESTAPDLPATATNAATSPPDKVLSEPTATSGGEEKVESPRKESAVDLFLDKFVPYEGQRHLACENIFATWDLNDTTNYSPIVRQGIFQSSSSHTLQAKSGEVAIPVQIHQAIGSSDCKTVGIGVLSPLSTSTPIKSIENTDLIIGELKYKLSFKDLPANSTPFRTEPSSPPKPFNGATNNSVNSVLPVSAEPCQTQPVPKPRRLPTQAEIAVYSSLAETSEGDDLSSGKSGRKKSKRKKTDTAKPKKNTVSPEGVIYSELHVSPKKPILRRESPEVKKKLVKRVTVTEVVEERRIPSSEEENKLKKVSTVKGSNSSGTSDDDNGSHRNFPIASIPVAPKITVENIYSPDSVSSRWKTKTTESTTELDHSSGSGDEKSQQPSSNLSKARKKRSRKSGSSKSSLELSENDSSSQDSETYNQTIRIDVAYIVLNSPSRIWGDPNVKKLFVEYRFLDFDPEELETPNSIPKPQPGKKGEFNFVKVFSINTKERRRLLQMMLQERKRIRFTVVSEPNENDTLDCEDIGYAYVPIISLLKEDLVQELIPVYDAENPRSEMGSICVSIQARQALKSL